MYRLAICDDNQADVSYLQALLEKWAESGWLHWGSLRGPIWA